MTLQGSVTKSVPGIVKKTVLVTRPQPRADVFIEMLTSNAINAEAFSTIEIQPVAINASLESCLRSLNEYSLILFISVNAVEQTLNLLQSLNLTAGGISAKIATIGKASLSAATQAGFAVSISPQSGYNSEALLAMDELQAQQIKAHRCLIIKGVGGLDNLADELIRRGAQVDLAEVYRRQKPAVDKNIRRQQLSENWDDFGINAITATSNESLQNLYDMLEPPGRSRMLLTDLVVVSQRGVELAKKLGFTSVSCAQSALNEHVLATLKIILNK